MLQVPPIAWGNARYSATELKIIQEVITLVVVSGFATRQLGEKIRRNHFAAFLCVVAVVAFTFIPRAPSGDATPAVAGCVVLRPK